MKIGNKEFQIPGKVAVLGILNVTPDSLSDGGKYCECDKALSHVEKMIEDGADIIDVGGQSTRPGYTEISASEEIERVLPVIEKIKSRFDVPISLDTYRSDVAKAGIAAGVDMINDIWGLGYDEAMAKVIAEGNVICCLGHNRKEAEYENIFKDITADFRKIIHRAESAGISDNKIILDPGIGFGKTHGQNLEIIENLEEFHMFGYPIMFGASRKSVIGNTLDLPVEERIEGTIATTVIAVMKGCSFVRVHDIKENVRAIKMAEACLHGRKWKIG